MKDDLDDVHQLLRSMILGAAIGLGILIFLKVYVL